MPAATKPVFLDAVFPLGGIETSVVYDQQPTRNTTYGPVSTTAAAQNVRAFEPETDRARGGSRPGIVKYVAGRVGG